MLSFFIQHSLPSLQPSALLEILTLFIKTVQLRPYVFLFVAAFLFSARSLIGWRRTGVFFVIVWITAFACEFSSTRTGLPFGWYHYTGSTVGQELYLSNVPFMDSLSFTMLLYASYCLALSFLLPSHGQSASKNASSRKWLRVALSLDRSIRTEWPALLLTTLFFVFLDMVIDPVALRGDQWFLGKIYYYSSQGLHFGVPVANYVGWAVVGVIALWIYTRLDRHLAELEPCSDECVTRNILIGCGLYYSILLFNLAITFWIDEPLIGMTGILIYCPLTALLLLRLLGKFPASELDGSRVPSPVRYSRAVPSHLEPVFTAQRLFHEHRPECGHESGFERLVVGPVWRRQGFLESSDVQDSGVERRRSRSLNPEQSGQGVSGEIIATTLGESEIRTGSLS